jgi:hypothetical protein
VILMNGCRCSHMQLCTAELTVEAGEAATPAG